MLDLKHIYIANMWTDSSSSGKWYQLVLITGSTPKDAILIKRHGPNNENPFVGGRTIVEWGDAARMKVEAGKVLRTRGNHGYKVAAYADAGGAGNSPGFAQFASVGRSYNGPGSTVLTMKEYLGDSLARVKNPTGTASACFSAIVDGIRKSQRSNSSAVAPEGELNKFRGLFPDSLDGASAELVVLDELAETPVKKKSAPIPPPKPEIQSWGLWS